MHNSNPSLLQAMDIDHNPPSIRKVKEQKPIWKLLDP